MISLGSKFADYGLTAGFMICAQVALLFWIAPDKADSVIVASGAAARSYLALLPESLATAASAVLAAFAIVSVFFVGLVLELIGSVAVIWEANVFKRNLARNRQWLTVLLTPYGEETEADLGRFLSEFGDPMGKQEWSEALHFWRRSAWTKSFARFRLLRPFSRLQSLLLAYIAGADAALRLDILQEHLHLCRISRAISASLYILAFELLVLPPSALPLPPSSGATLWQYYLEIRLFAISMFALAIFLPVKAYGRFCDSLFALVLVLYRKAQASSEGVTRGKDSAPDTFRTTEGPTNDRR